MVCLGEAAVELVSASSSWRGSPRRARPTFHHGAAAAAILFARDAPPAATAAWAVRGGQYRRQPAMYHRRIAAHASPARLLPGAAATKAPAPSLAIFTLVARTRRRSLPLRHAARVRPASTQVLATCARTIPRVGVAVGEASESGASRRGSCRKQRHSGNRRSGQRRGWVAARPLQPRPVRLCGRIQRPLCRGLLARLRRCRP